MNRQCGKVRSNSIPCIKDFAVRPGRGRAALARVVFKRERCKKTTLSLTMVHTLGFEDGFRQMKTTQRRNTTMKSRYSFKETLEKAERIGWRVEDIIGGDKRLDFKRPFLTESLDRAHST